MQKDKLLTLVIPTYNMERYLDNCLSSLLVDEPLLESLEVLVVNDGSKDKSMEIASEYASRLPNVFKAIDKPNGNYGSCVNRGLFEAKGKYIKVLDADDHFDKNEFTHYLTKLKNVNADLVITPYSKVDPEGHIKFTPTYPLDEADSMPVSVINRLLDLEMHALTYRTDFLRSIGYKQTEGISYTDTEWVLIPMPQVSTLAFINNNVYRYLVGRNGQTVDPSILLRNHVQLIQVFRNILDHICNNKNLGEATDFINRKYCIGMHLLYSLVLIKGKAKNTTHLLDFDKYLKAASPSLYKQTDELNLDRRISYKFIHDWRKRYKYKDISSVALFSLYLLNTLKKAKKHLTK